MKENGADAGRGAEGSSVDSLAVIVTGEVQRALAARQAALTPQAVSSAGKLAGSVAAAIAHLPRRHREFIFSLDDDLEDFASEIVLKLAAEVQRRLDGAPALAEPALEPVRPALQAAPVRVLPHEGSADLRTRFEALRHVPVEQWAGRVAGSTYLEKNLRIARSTLNRWQRSNDVVGLRTGDRKHVFPLAQFVDGRPAPAIRDIVAILANMRFAWFWLIQPCATLGGSTPIDLLREDRVAEVLAAAREASLD